MQRSCLWAADSVTILSEVMRTMLLGILASNFLSSVFWHIQQQDKRIETSSYINTLKSWKEGIREKKTNTRGSTKSKEEFFTTFISRIQSFASFL